MNGTRTQAERDAVTVEIGFALLSAAVLAGLVFLGFLGAHALLPLPDTRTWLTLGKSTAATVFVGRVLYVLLRSRAGGRHEQEYDADGEDGEEGADRGDGADRTDGQGRADEDGKG
jgi:hypothetical protein